VHAQTADGSALARLGIAPRLHGRLWHLLRDSGAGAHGGAAAGGCGANPFGGLVEESGGLDALEALQTHPNVQVRACAVCACVCSCARVRARARACACRCAPTRRVVA
jgi:hypothetical protein